MSESESKGFSNLSKRKSSSPGDDRAKHFMARQVFRKNSMAPLSNFSLLFIRLASAQTIKCSKQ